MVISTVTDGSRAQLVKLQEPRVILTGGQAMKRLTGPTLFSDKRKQKSQIFCSCLKFGPTFSQEFRNVKFSSISSKF